MEGHALGDAQMGQKGEKHEEGTSGKRKRSEAKGWRDEEDVLPLGQVGLKEGEMKGHEAARKTPGTSAMDDPDGEDAFALLDGELEQGPWDAWVTGSDGFGGGME